MTNNYCSWTEDDTGRWETSCNELWEFFEGTPEDNRIKYCCFCGKPLAIVSYEDELMEEYDPHEDDPIIIPEGE